MRTTRPGMVLDEVGTPEGRSWGWAKSACRGPTRVTKDVSE
ncbi:hypothetical protein AB0I46_37170 [Streptomyces spectabilis]